MASAEHRPLTESERRLVVNHETLAASVREAVLAATRSSRSETIISRPARKTESRCSRRCIKRRRGSIRVAK